MKNERRFFFTNKNLDFSSPKFKLATKTIFFNIVQFIRLYHLKTLLLSSNFFKQGCCKIEKIWGFGKWIDWTFFFQGLIFAQFHNSISETKMLRIRYLSWRKQSPFFRLKDLGLDLQKKTESRLLNNWQKSGREIIFHL